MATTADDISMVLSGGTTNIDTNQSLGGDPSSVPITDSVLNNLFDDVSPAESVTGVTDYRCLYIFNDGTSPIHLVNFWIQDDFTDAASLSMGTIFRDEIQRITLSGSPTSGNLTLSYRGTSFTTSYDSDLSAWVASIQDALDGLTDGSDLYFREVSVTGQAAGSNTIFDISFSGKDGRKSHDRFLVVSNTLTPATGVVITAPQEGSPINTIAPEINVETTPPGGVVFVVPTSDAPLTLPKLMPEDGFPLWIKRTVAAGTEGKEDDGLKIRFSAQSGEPQ